MYCKLKTACFYLKESLSTVTGVALLKIIMRTDLRCLARLSSLQYNHENGFTSSNTAPRLPGQTSIFDVVFLESRSLVEIERLMKPRSHVRILTYRT